MRYCCALVVANPRAGRCDPALLRATLATLFGPFGLDYQLHIMGSGEELGEVVGSALAGGCDLVVAAGGDGTVAAVANHLVGRDVPLGILPVGTGNALAREIGVPRSLPDAAALLVARHRLVALDGIRVGTRHYFVNAGIGLNAAIVRDTRSEEKRLLGTLAYGFALVRWAIGHGATRFAIRVDGRDRRYRAWDVFVANVGLIGATGVYWGPVISARDGLLDLLVVRVPTLPDYLRMFWHLLIGGRLHRALVSHHRIRREVEIAADRPLAIQADGEQIVADTLTVEVVPRAIRIVAPLAGGRCAASVSPDEVKAAEQIRAALGSRVGVFARLDTGVFLAVGRLPHSPALEAAIRIAWIVPAAIRGFLIVSRRAAWVRSEARPDGLERDLVSRVLIPTALAWAFAALPSRLLGRLRVAEAAVLAPVSATKPSAWSSPSARTAAAFAAARLLSGRLPAWGLAARIGALLLGASRVYLGGRYASDVVVGGLCGWLLAPIAVALVERVRRRRRDRLA